MIWIENHQFCKSMTIINELVHIQPKILCWNERNFNEEIPKTNSVSLISHQNVMNIKKTKKRINFVLWNSIKSICSRVNFNDTVYAMSYTCVHYKFKTTTKHIQYSYSYNFVTWINVDSMRFVLFLLLQPVNSLFPHDVPYLLRKKTFIIVSIPAKYKILSQPHSGGIMKLSLSREQTDINPIKCGVSMSIEYN